MAFRPWLQSIAVAGLLLGAADSTRADVAPVPEPLAVPKNYVVGVLGTTLAYRPPGGPLDGWQHSLSLVAGYGRFIRPKIALQLDAGLLLIRGDYASFSLTPAVLWTFSAHVYAAMRFVVPIDPEVNLVLFPGIGVSHFFPNGIGVSLELNPASTVGRGDPDFLLAMGGAVVYPF